MTNSPCDFIHKAMLSCIPFALERPFLATNTSRLALVALHPSPAAGTTACSGQHTVFNTETLLSGLSNIPFDLPSSIRTMSSLSPKRHQKRELSVCWEMQRYVDPIAKTWVLVGLQTNGAIPKTYQKLRGGSVSCFITNQISRNSLRPVDRRDRSKI